MSIRIVLGNVGSGKTANTVRWMKEHNERTIYTNIQTFGKDFKHVIQLKPEMIIQKIQKKVKRNGEEVFEYKLNVDYWQKVIQKEKRIHVVIDEAHTFFNSRRAMSKVNIVMNDFLALLRRILGDNSNSGELILITQLSRRLDVIAKEMSTRVQYMMCEFDVICSQCGHIHKLNNEHPIQIEKCIACNSYKINRKNLVLNIWEFANIDAFERWFELNDKSYFQRYKLHGIENIFNNYDTLQWDDLLSNY